VSVSVAGCPACCLIDLPGFDMSLNIIGNGYLGATLANPAGCNFNYNANGWGATFYCTDPMPPATVGTWHFSLFNNGTAGSPNASCSFQAIVTGTCSPFNFTGTGNFIDQGNCFQPQCVTAVNGCTFSVTITG
jgi:hypothetical protein